MPSLSCTTCPWHVGAGRVAGATADLAKEALFVSVGFAVLAFQRAQVGRRELTSALTTGLGTPLGVVADVVTAVEHSLSATTRQLRHTLVHVGR